jgi:hypothetical protein
MQSISSYLVNSETAKRWRISNCRGRIRSYGPGSYGPGAALEQVRRTLPFKRTTPLRYAKDNPGADGFGIETTVESGKPAIRKVDNAPVKPWKECVVDTADK